MSKEPFEINTALRGMESNDLTFDDLLLYGYSFEGMTPLSKAAALERYDSNQPVYLLYGEDAEGMAESRGDIEKFDGMFGVENGLYENRQAAGEAYMPIAVFVANTNPRGDERAVVERLRLPADRGEACSVLSEVGADVDDPSTYRIVAFHADETVKPYLSKSGSLDEMNMLAEYLYDMEDWEWDKFGAILQSGLVKTEDAAGLINILDADNFDRFDLIPAQNPEALGRYWAEEAPNAIPEGMSLAEYGRQCVLEEKGVFTDYGDIRQKYSGMEAVYDGVVPKPYRLTKDKPVIEKPSVLAQIREAKAKAVHGAEPKERPKNEHKSDMER